MDAWAWLTSQIGEFIVGVALLLIGYGYIRLGLTIKTLKFFRIAGVVLVALAVLSYLGINLFATEEAPPATTVGAFDVAISESMSWITVDNNANLVTWAVTYNTTAQNFVGNTKYCQLSIAVDRGLGNVGLTQTYGDVNSIPSVTNDTTGVSYPILTKTNDQYNALWTRSDSSTAYKMVTITIPENQDGVSVTLNLTLNGDAIKSMDRYDSVDIGMVIGGQTWTIQVLLANVVS